MGFGSIEIDKWKQFSSLNIKFHPAVTIITGANGSGKTTVLGMLSQHFGWERRELATPIREEATGIFSFVSRLFGYGKNSGGVTIGHITYSNGQKTPLRIPVNPGSAQYSISIEDHPQISGVSIPSHRSVYNYQQVPHISTQKRAKRDAFNLASSSSMNKYQNGGGQSASYFIKETLLSWAVGGSGNEFIQSDQQLIAFYRGFEDILSKVLPPNLGFCKLSIRSYEVVLETKSGDFLLDAVSGGISTIIDLAWQIYNFQTDEKSEFSVIIDEVENHLHPSMQRRILQDFQKAFPNAQFIVSTHSPLIVGSVRDSSVYALRYNDDNKIFSEELNFTDKAGNASQILNDVLGVPVTMPIWAENDLEVIIKSFGDLQEGRDLESLREKLSKSGLSAYFPEALTKILGGVK